MEEYQYQPTINDNFDDDQIIVTIKEEYSAVNKVFNLEDFVIENLIISNNPDDEISNSECVFLESLEDLTYIDEPSKIKNTSTFSQIFSLIIKNKSKENVLKAINYLSNLYFVQCAEPSYIYETVESWTPDDTMYLNQWGLNHIGISNAWNFSIGNTTSRIKVGIFEKNIQADHEDLNVIPGNFTPDSSDSAEHGTHVAGIIGAISNNSTGVSGIAQVDIALLDCNNFVSSIRWAINNDIRVINASFYYGYTDSSGNKILTAPNQSHAKAIENFGNAGGILITSAGNSGTTTLGNLDNTPQYPAGYGDPRKYPNITNVIAVGALNQDGTRRMSSNYGVNSVHIYAPGGNIISTLPGNSYGRMSGTSMAAPHVTGVAALMLSINSNISAEGLKNAILNNSETISIRIPTVAGGTTFTSQNVKSLNALKAVTSVAFNTSSNDDGITLEGLTNEFNFFDGSQLVLPNSFTQYGRPLASGHQNIIGIGVSCFENNNVIENITLPTNVNIIGSYSFKNCKNLEEVIIPNSVTHIDTSAFEGCSYLQSATLSTNLIAIGSSAFKGCASLESISIPNSVTHIDTSAFEGCSYLQSVTLSTNLIAIGSSAFKGCGSLERIVIPLSVQYIDDEAFKNCSSLSVVTVNRRITNITNLGVSVFDGCNASLKIIVPVNRIAEYKNKEYWSSYRNKIMPSEDYAELEIDCEGNVSESLSLSKATNELYKLNVNCSKSYKINANSSNNVNIIIYDSNMNVISSGSNTVTQFLGCGIYYISFEFDDTNASGTFEIGISLTWTSSNILLNKGTNNIKNSMHLNNGNAYHCSYEYFNNQGEGFYRFSLNIGSNEILPEGTIKIYSNINKTELLNRYGSTGINEQAITYNGENELYVFLPENGYYYIDIVLPKSTYSLITLTIEQIEQKDINYQNRLDTNTIDELFDNKTNTNYFEEVTISHRSKIELDIVTSGTINRNIPIYIFEKHRDPGYEPGDNHYYLVLEYTNNITSINRSPIFTIILNPGTYYIGYSDNFDKVQIQFALRRKVNTDLNIDGTLVTDPARNQGFPLGSEVTFNNGALLGNTITEGFTRNIYLMVEDRVNDPMSRLEYDWYSSNENVAKVTKYGTVLALNVNENTTVTIYAINKDDPSIVYKKDFVILKETKTEQIVIECNMSYSYSEENGMYTLELDFTNSPYPYIGYYVWDIESFNGISVDMEHYGLIYSTGPGEALLTANYILNMRIFLKIHLTITE